MCRICDDDPDLPDFVLPDLDLVRHDEQHPALPRRRFLEIAGLGAAAAFTLGLKTPDQAPPEPHDPTERYLDLYRIHSRKRLRVTYMRDGNYVDAALEQIDRICQDNLQKQHTQMDVALIDHIWMLKELVAPDAVIDIVSAYRTYTTNARLRSKSKNVAKRSLHMDGRAIDIRIRGVSASLVADLAENLAMGGVGYYDRSQFTHIDTGRPRRWNI